MLKNVSYSAKGNNHNTRGKVVVVPGGYNYSAKRDKRTDKFNSYLLNLVVPGRYNYSAKRDKRTDKFNSYLLG